MKTLTCKKTVVLLLCLTATAVAFAGGGKGLIKGGKGLFQAPRTARGTSQLFNGFSRQTANAIRRGITEGKFDRQLATATLNTPAALRPALDKNSYTHAIVSGQPVAKLALTKMREENLFYAPEIDAARAIRNQILNITILTDEGQIALANTIHAGIKNHTLKQELLLNLENLDIYSMAKDLTDYFCLDKSFEEAAFEYTLRHPHQMNLNLRRLMHNPLVDDALKQDVKHFLEVRYIAPEQYDSFRAVIHAAHVQYQERLSAAKFSDIIQAQVAYYEDFAMRLDEAIRENGGYQLKWNTSNQHHQDLLEEFQWIERYDPMNQFNPLISYRKQIQVIWNNAHKPLTLSLEKTLALYETFVKTTLRPYPQTLTEQTPTEPGFIPFEQEELLWDSLEYWRVEDEKNIFPQLVKIRHQYLK